MLTSPRVDSFQVIRSVAVTAPAVRTLIVEVWASREAGSDWTTGSDVYPVLAIESTLVAQFSRPHRPDDRRLPTSATDARRLGYIFEGLETRHELLIADSEYDGIGPASLTLGSSNTAHRVVVATWDPSEDEARLASVVATLTALAIENAARAETQRRPAAALTGWGPPV